MHVIQRSEYDLMINSVKIMQQQTLSSSEGDNKVYNKYLINSPKVNTSAENVHLWYKHNLADFKHWYILRL